MGAGRGEMGAGRVELPGVERGPGCQIVQVGQRAVEPAGHPVGASTPSNRRQHRHQGFVTGTAAVLMVNRP
ncbi:hypothetical protein Acsp05_58840 [Actinokineospora sp. NBRC 105648]|nr:hypothetical protein Acsp05_58840 [Actinokineospora sp. NBRC 105648]